MNFDKEFLAQKRADAVKKGNLVIALFIASLMTDRKLSPKEVDVIILNKGGDDATYKSQIWAICFCRDPFFRWSRLEQLLNAYLGLKKPKFIEALFCLRRLKELVNSKKLADKYKNIIENLPIIFYQHNLQNEAFQDFMHKELHELSKQQYGNNFARVYENNFDPDKLIKQYAREFFYFVEKGFVSRLLLTFCSRDLAKYDGCTDAELIEQLKKLAIDFGAEVEI